MTAPALVATANRRFLVIDAIKGVACLLIVAHHLSVYGPMSDQASLLLPGVIGWLYDYGRWVVQVFLVIGGYFAAASLAPDLLRPAQQRESACALIWRRYCRLVLPYGFAVAVSVLVAALVRPWFVHLSVPAAPSLRQVIVHAALLQDLLGFKALSAGFWYVAIDFQLYALTVGVFSGAAAVTRRWPGLGMLRGEAILLGLGLASLLVFNRNSVLDACALYFVGAYALGMLAYWTVPHPSCDADAASLSAKGWGSCLLLFFGAAALLVEFRGRVALAWIVAVSLVAVRLFFDGRTGTLNAAKAPRWWQRLGPSLVQALARVGLMSYSIFLIHFPVCLLVNAVMAKVWPAGAWVNLLGMAAAVGLSLVAGSVLFRWVEQAPSRRRARRGKKAHQSSPPVKSSIK